MPEVQETTTPVKRGAWLGTELAVLREHYHSRGAAWCAAELNRPISAVHAAAERNGIARDREETRFRWTPERDAVVRRAYESGEWGAAQRIAAMFGVHHSTISRRAGELGVSKRPDAKRWTKPELDFAAAHAHLSHDYISKLMRERGWKRSGGSVQRALKARSIASTDERHLTASGVANILGVDPKTVLRWIHAGDITCQPRNDVAEGAHTAFLIETHELARFIVQNPLKVDPRKFDWPWVSDLLAKYGSLGLIEGRSMMERVAALAQSNRSPREIAEILDSTPNSVSVMLSRIRSRERRAAA